MLLDEHGLEEYADRFAFEAVRQEVLDQYNVPSDGGDFGRYLTGAQHPDPAVIAPWRDWVRDRRRRGAAVRRVRVLHDNPPGMCASSASGRTHTTSPRARRSACST